MGSADPPRQNREHERDPLCAHTVNRVYGQRLKGCDDQGVSRQDRNALTEFGMD